MKCLENIRMSITRADARVVQSPAVIVADREVLLATSDTVLGHTPKPLRESHRDTRSAFP